MIDLTNQQIFDKVATHLLTQKTKSMDGFQCRYRGPNDAKCAIGCLIPDEVYKCSMEGCTVYDSPIADLFLPSQRSFLNMLQVTHDKYPAHIWADMLINIAINSQLDSSIVNTFKANSK